MLTTINQLINLCTARERTDTGQQLVSNTIFCSTQHRLTSVTTSSAVAVLVLQGSKRLWVGDNHITCTGGSMIMLPPATGCVIENIPDPVLGKYLAFFLPFTEGMLARVSSNQHSIQPDNGLNLQSFFVTVDSAIVMARKHLLVGIGDSRIGLRVDDLDAFSFIHHPVTDPLGY